MNIINIKVKVIELATIELFQIFLSTIFSLNMNVSSPF